MLTKTRSEFTELASPELRHQQARAVDIFFEDIAGQYVVAKRDLEGWVSSRDAQSPEAGYDRARKTSMQALEYNADAYKAVAAAHSLTFDLSVESLPPVAAVSYKRTGDQYTSHPRPTDTTIYNLVFAVWIVHVHEDTYEDQEKEHDPSREPNHVVHFDLKPK